MTTPDTKKPSIWKYFDHIDRDKTFSKARCKFCDYSTHYSGNTSILRKHLLQHKDLIMQLEADSKGSNPSVSNHNYKEETRDAATIIEAVNTTASNYDYNCFIKTKIMHHAKLLFQAPTIVKDSPNSIRAFVKHIRTHLDSLKSLNVPVNTWDIPVILHIRPKLDGNTRLGIQYDETLKSDEIPTLNQLLEFLTERAKCLDTTPHSIPNNEHATSSQRSSAQGNNDDRRGQQNILMESRYQLNSSPHPSTSQSQIKHQSSSQQSSTRRPSFSRPSSACYLTSRASSSYSSSQRLQKRSPIATRKIECPICETDEHRIYRCGRFRKWTVSQREHMANLYSLCLNCLRRGNHTSGCRSRKCGKCDQRHHSLLHPTH